MVREEECTGRHAVDFTFGKLFVLNEYKLFFVFLILPFCVFKGSFIYRGDV